MNQEQRERLIKERNEHRWRGRADGPFHPNTAKQFTEVADAIDAALRRIERLEKALAVGIAYMENGDWSNGVTDASGTIDEGETRAFRDLWDCKTALEGRD